MMPITPTVPYSSAFSLILVQARSLTLKSPASEYTCAAKARGAHERHARLSRLQVLSPGLLVLVLVLHARRGPAMQVP